MNSARYYVALIFAIMMLPPVLVWMFIHPLSAKWRKVGPVGTYIFISIFVAAGIFLLWCIRDWLLSIEFGFKPFLSILASIFFIAAICFRIMWRKELRPTTLLGVPEIFGRNNSEELVTEGIYSYMRHPRYTEIGMVLVAAALFSNYLVSYIVMLLYIPLITIVVLLEERELRDRFGELYEAYCMNVPRFIPQFRSHTDH